MSSTCQCATGNTTGYLTDDTVPIVDISQPEQWASQFYTVNTTLQRYMLGFRFREEIQVAGVQIFMFHCASWGYAPQSIHIRSSFSFPQPLFFGASGSVDLNRVESNCNSLTLVNISTHTDQIMSNSYYIDFSSIGNPMIIYIAEVRFSNDSTFPFDYPQASSVPAIVLHTTNSNLKFNSTSIRFTQTGIVSQNMIEFIA